MLNDVERHAEAWNSSGYLTLHSWVTSYVVNQYGGIGQGRKTELVISPYVQRYPRSNVYEDSVPIDFFYGRYSIWRFAGPIFVSIAMLYPLIELMASMVEDRENKMKDLLEISGLMPLSYLYSFNLAGFLFSFISAMFICLLLAGTMIIHKTTMVAYGSVLLMYALASPPFLACLGYIFCKSNYFGMCVSLLTASLSVGGIFVAQRYGDISQHLRLFLSFLFPPMGLSLAIFNIEQWASDNPNLNQDVQFSYYFESKKFPSISSILGIFVLSHVFYTIIAWAMPFDWLLSRTADSPTDRGKIEIIASAQHRSYHSDIEPHRPVVVAGAGAGAGAGSRDRDHDRNGEFGEDKDKDKDEDEDEEVLVVDNVSHVYDNMFHALKGLSFSVRKGQVLSFLGTNGAGKSTTMSILSGVLDPTVGDARVSGISIRDNRTLARRKLGICMQQDILWPDMSISFHLYFFGRLRGLSGVRLRAAVDTMLSDLGFPEKRDSLAGTLSGGQRRRLCVAISMIGDNSAVLLDEPTAGLDPVSRRQVSTSGALS